MLDRPAGVPVDPLSDALALVDARCLFSALFTAGGDWAIRFAHVPAGVKFGVILQGRCWLVFDGSPATELQTGDCYLLTSSRPYVLASDPNQRPRDFDGTLQCGVRSDVRIAGGRFNFAGPGASLLIELLPQMLHEPAGSSICAALPWVLEQLRIELATAYPGSTLMSKYYANIVFVEMLRMYLATAHENAGWLRRLADERISEAIHLIHREPARRWTVDHLARAVGLSRSTFALRFKTLVGAAPLEYILNWRVRLAERALLDRSATVATVAGAIGYESVSAFSNAFKRVTGSSPSDYRTARLKSKRRQ